MLYDLCIVGAGMFGSAAARHASTNPSIKVCLIGPKEPTDGEWKDREILSSHYDEGRITRIVDDDPACQILSEYSIRRYKDIERLSGITFYTPVGGLIISKKNGKFENKISQSANENVSSIEISHETFRKRYPYLRLKDDETALLDDNGAGHISPRKIVEAQKKIARKQGCDVYESVVSDIKLGKDGLYQIELEKDEPCVILAKRVILATGAFVNTKKFSALKRLKVKTYKRTVAFLKLPEEEAKRLSSMTFVIYRGVDEEGRDRSAYILPPIQYPNGDYYLKIGYYGRDLEADTLEDIIQWFLSEGEKELVDLGTNLLLELLPGLKYKSISSSTCVNCYTPTGLPYVDRITPTLTIAVAGNGKGAKFSDEIGRLVAELSLKGKWDSQLDKSRFEAIFEE